MMIFGGKYMLVGVLLLSLVSCRGGSQPDAAVPETPTIAASPPSSRSDPQSEPDTPEEIAPEGEIWSRLRQADTHYYVLMRHAIAPGSGDPANFQLKDCSTQRNLSEEGREQARRTGAVFREQHVSVQQVLSSEWCRCLDTAELMNLGTVEPFPALNSFFQNRAQGPKRIQQLREFMSNNREDAGVTVLVTHFVTIAGIAGNGVASGELVVMQVNDDNEPEVIAAIGPF